MNDHGTLTSEEKLKIMLVPQNKITKLVCSHKIFIDT